MARKQSKHSAPKTNENKSILITFCIFIAVVLLCIAAGIAVIIITGAEKTLHAPVAPTPTPSYTNAYFDQATSSKEREPAETDTGIITYHANNVLDRDSSTTWTPQENIDNPWIEISSDKPALVRGIKIENGYSKSENLYAANRRAKNITVEILGESYKYELKDAGCGKVQNLSLPETVHTDKIKITVNSYYEGTKYKDICITEILPY